MGERGEATEASHTNLLLEFLIARHVNKSFLERKPCHKRSHLAPRRTDAEGKSHRGADLGSKTMSSNQSWMTLSGF